MSFIEKTQRLINKLSPQQMLVLSFVTLILAGSFLLSLPLAASSGNSLPYIDALFTSTSAVCVTGLSTINIADDLSLFGKIVVLFLIQIGGIGIVTFSLFFMLMMGKKISFRGRDIVHSSFTGKPTQYIAFLFKTIFVFTIAIELVGAFVLFVDWYDEMPSALTAFWYSLFHSISAFCNAGFSIFADGLVGFKTDILTNLTVSTLIIAGGLGFTVIMELYGMYGVSKYKGEFKKLSLHSKIVITTSFWLIVSGWLIFFLIEYDKSVLEGLSFSEKLMAAFFASVTARTAGFNTVDYTLFTNATIFLTMALMFIGASPGSTGGGIKTSTFATLYGIMKTRFLGRKDVCLYRRTIPYAMVTKAMALVLGAMFLVFVATALLFVIEGGSHNERLFMELMFESISAFGTVGLSLGVTSKLSTAGKLVIICLMFAGRVGMLTMAMIMSKKEQKISYKYAEENIMIG